MDYARFETFLMRPLLQYKLLLLLLVLFSACVGDKHLTEVTYFGGKIINPKDSKVFFYSGDKLIDSVKLSEKNKFIFKFDSIKEGMYTFVHGPEIQFIFLQPSDSLLLRLNTWDFDESLVFSGKGAERNNLLINLFLVKEKEDKLFYKYYALNDSLFNLKIDSLLKERHELYSNFKKENEEGISQLFDKHVNAIIEFPLYVQKEAYPYRHKKALGLTEYPHMNPKFYKFRKHIDIDDPELSSLYVFRDYVRTYLSHVSYEKELVHGKESPMAVNFLETVAENINNEALKNRLLDEAIWSVSLNDELPKHQKEKAKKIFFEHCNDEKLTKGLHLLVKAQEALPNQTALPELTVVNSFNNRLLINDAVKGSNAVIYFWPENLRQLENLAKRVRYLEKQHPSVLFVGIDARHPEKKWKHYIKSHKFKVKEQFQLDKGLAPDWLYVDHSRAILINKNGIVTNSFTHLSSRSINYQLKKLEKY